jgi:hypothetical protein
MMIQAPPSGSKGGRLLAWKTDINIASLFYLVILSLFGTL